MEYFEVKRGNEVLEGQQWAGYLSDSGIEVIPTLHANSGPFGVVQQATYEGFKNEILQGIREAGKIDGIYLDMHGALHAEGYEDAQLDFIRTIRDIVGDDVLICGSFDLHGNMSEGFVQGLDILTAYRTAPHVDADETRLRAVTLLHNALKNNLRPEIIHVNVPILIPGEKGITSTEPLGSLYQKLSGISDKPGLMDASIFVGMPWTDVARAGMSIQIVMSDQSYRSMAQKELSNLARQLWDAREDLKFDVATASIDEAIEIALNASESTVFITDSGDNTTAGAGGDNTLVLRKLLAKNVKNALFAGIVDPQAVNICERAGIGSVVNLTLGGKLDPVFGEQLEITGTVRYLTTEPGENNKRPVVLEIEGLTLVLLNAHRSFISPDDFKEIGLDALNYKIVVVKLGYLFQGLRDIAPRTIMALTPGFANQVIQALPYKNISRPIYPVDKDMDWEIN